jgi:hypothetical protein
MLVTVAQTMVLQSCMYWYFQKILLDTILSKLIDNIYRIISKDCSLLYLTKRGYGIKTNNQCCQLYKSNFGANKCLHPGEYWTGNFKYCWTLYWGLSAISQLKSMSVFRHVELIIGRNKVTLVGTIIYDVRKYGCKILKSHHLIRNRIFGFM